MNETSRRDFLTTLGALAGTAVIPTAIESQPVPQGGGWDMSWLDRLTGKHRQVFDFTNPQMLQVPRNWLDAHEVVYGLKHSDLSAVVGIGGPSFPVNATDAMYEKYPIGTEWKITDPTTGKPAILGLGPLPTATVSQRLGVHSRGSRPRRRTNHRASASVAAKRSIRPLTRVSL